MATASAGAKKPKNLAAAERVRNATIGAGEPIITEENYNTDIANAFFYYNTYVEDKNKRKWVQKYLADDKVALGKLVDVTDFDLRQPATLIRLAERGQPLRPEHLAQIDRKLDLALNPIITKAFVVKSDESSVAVKPQITVLQRVDNIASTYIADVEYELDKFFIDKKSDFSMKDYIASKQINGATAKIIAKWFTKTLDEVSEATTSTDEQLVESYSHFSSAQLKRLQKMLQGIIDDCVQQKIKAVKKPRKAKVKPASEVVKKLKYLPEFHEDGLDLKSEHPVKLVNSNIAWIYNVKNCTMTVLKAVDNDVLVVKANTIINFDTSKSETRKLRKPSEFMATKMTKRELDTAFKALTTKPSVAKGRMSDECIIVAVFI